MSKQNINLCSYGKMSAGRLCGICYTLPHMQKAKPFDKFPCCELETKKERLLFKFHQIKIMIKYMIKNYKNN